MKHKKVGILAYGAYLPQRRLQRASIYSSNAWFVPELRSLAKGERAIGSWDEDVITMAVEAGRNALVGVDRTTIGALSLSSTTLPFADRLNAGVVKEALTLKDDVGAVDITGSQRAGTSALAQALRAAGPEVEPQLCIAADMSKAAPGSELEMTAGDGAAAMLVGAVDPIATFKGAYSETIDFVDHYRTAGVDFDYTWESRWIREEGYLKIAVEALKSALASFAVAPREINHCAIAICAPKAAQAIAGKAGINPESLIENLVSNIGDTGVGHPSLMLAAALERARPGEKILVLGFGQGVDVLLFEATEAINDVPQKMGVAGSVARGKPDENYLRYLFHRGLLPMDRGMRAEFDQRQPAASLYRNRRAVLGLVGGRCPSTGTVQYPQSEISIDPNDSSIGTQEDYFFAERTARVMTYTADRLAYSPDPPTYYGAVDFDGGGRITVEFADVNGVDIDVGQPMKMVFRIKAVDEKRHFYRYFWKAAPCA